MLSIIQTTARPFPNLANAGGGNPAAACPSVQSCNCTTSLCGAGLLDAGAALAATPAPPAAAGRQIDFNADAKDDLVWRNSGSGAAAVWLMNGTGTLGAAIVYPGGTNYAVTNTGDLNGDGKTDLICRNTAVLDGRLAHERHRGDIVGDPVERSDLVGHARCRLQRRRQGRSVVAQHGRRPDRDLDP